MDQDAALILSYASAEVACAEEERIFAIQHAARVEKSAARDAAEELEWISDAPCTELEGTASADVIDCPSEATARMQKCGVVRVNGCASPYSIAGLLDHIDAKLAEAEANVAATPTDHEATKFFGRVRRPINRTDLKLELLEPVAAVVAEALKPLRAVCSDILSADAELFELGVFISEPNAPRQGVHPDTKFTPKAIACSIFVALQDIDASMGPTEFFPGTHYETAHTALQTRTQRATSALAGEAPSCGATDATMGPRERLLRSAPRHLATLRRGDAVMFDTRCLHCGGANESSRRRVLLYVSFRLPGAHTPYGRGSLDEEIQSRSLALRHSSQWLALPMAPPPAPAQLEEPACRGGTAEGEAYTAVAEVAKQIAALPASEEPSAELPLEAPFAPFMPTLLKTLQVDQTTTIADSPRDRQ